MRGSATSSLPASHWPHPSPDSLPCTAAVCAQSGPLRGLGRRKDRIVTAPEAGSRQAPRAQATQLSPGHYDDRARGGCWRRLGRDAHGQQRRRSCGRGFGRDSDQSLRHSAGEGTPADDPGGCRVPDADHGREPEDGHPPVLLVRRISGSSGSSGSDSVPVDMPPPDPGTAQSTAFGLLSSYGFASSQWGCLDDLWQRESGWD